MRDRQQRRLIVVIVILSAIVLVIAGGLFYYTVIQKDTSMAYPVTSPAQNEEISGRVLYAKDGSSSQNAASDPSVSDAEDDSSADDEENSSAAGSEVTDSAADDGATASAVSSEAAVSSASGAETDSIAGDPEAASTATEPSPDSAGTGAKPVAEPTAPSNVSPEADTGVTSASDAPAASDPAAAGSVSGESVASGSAAGLSESFDARQQLALSKTDSAFWEGCPPRNIALLTPNEYSRPQIALDTVNTLVIHYVGNSGSSAMENRDYFESLKDSHVRSASSHFVIGLDGEIVQCVPLSEVAYATKQRNADTISIECCHPDDDGKFNEYTYWSLVELSAWLCLKFHLDPQEILRHYDVTEKLCPLYYVEHPDAWQELKDTIQVRLAELKMAATDAEQEAAERNG